MSKLKFGIIGVGNRGVECFARLLLKREDVELVAWCDNNSNRMAAHAAMLGITPKAWTDPQQMLRSQKLDALIITTPDYCHEEHATLALRHGIPVLIDKPLATSVRGCRNIMEAAGRYGKAAMIGFNLRCHAVLRRLKELIDDGVLGKVFLIENREFYNGGRTYLSRWNRFYGKSGGLWIHKGSHDFDIFNWLLNFPKPTKVTAFAGISVFQPTNLPFPLKANVPVGPNCSSCAYAKVCPDVFILPASSASAWGPSAIAEDQYVKDLCMYTSEKDTHDNGIAIVEYENGARASHLECFVTSLDDRRYTVVGDRGIAEVSLEERRIIIRPRWSREVTTHNIPEAEGGHGGADPGLLESFIRILRGEQTNSSTLEHGLWSTAIGQAAEISRREGRLVHVSELFEG